MKTTNDGTNSPPHIESYMNLGTLEDLPLWSTAPKGVRSTNVTEVAQALITSGYTGVQCSEPEQYMAAGLRGCILGRANTPEEIRELTRSWAYRGLDCGTLHVGWGFETDEQSIACAQAVVECSEQFSIPLYLEIHRATIAQDPWRTLQIVKEVPEIRFNGDFSHWYTGLELVYGDFVHKLNLLQPVFERVRFMHLRVGNSGSMQLSLKEPSMIVAMDHYMQMWHRSMRGFLTSAGPGDFFIIAPELLSPAPNYARRIFKPEINSWEEDSDRWEESLTLTDMARDCFKRALADLS